jgi:dipeptidyl aminopeptidase/acylaminoacyl peptidase
MRTYCYIALLAAQAVLSGQPTGTTVPKVVFVKGTEIYSASLDGSNITQLTKDGLRKDLPKWSPEGSRIAYMAASSNPFGEFTLITSTGKRLARFPLLSEGERGMRWIEGLDWLDGNHVVFWGSANPWNCTEVAVDVMKGDGVFGHLGTCRTFVRSPDGKSTAYWGPEGMGFSSDERRESLYVDDADVYPQVVYPQTNSLQFLSKPVWSADSQRVALVDQDVNTGITSLTILDPKPEHATGQRKSFDYLAKWAPILMHAPLGSDPDEGMEVQWVGNLVLLSKEGGAALFLADPAHGTVQPAPADALQSLAEPRAQAAQLKSKAEDLVRKLGGSDFDIWTGPPSTARSN